MRVVLLVVQHNVGHPDELRRDSDGRHIVEVRRTPPQLVIRPFLSMNTHFYVILGHKTHLNYIYFTFRPSFCFHPPVSATRWLSSSDFSHPVFCK